ncbi:MAG: DUF2207 domain-containing protein [Pseudomonadota bacterium]
MRQRLFRTLCVVLAMFWMAGYAHSAEEILNFNSRVEVFQSGKLRVVETIRVRGENSQIRRGIYRDFPLMVEDAGGREREVGFEVISVTRDGNPDDFRIDKASRSARVYIGDKDVFIGAGEFTYKITYETDRQIRYFSDYDELNWNVTGNFWNFPILQARAEIVLPQGVRATDTAYFTGRFGATGRAARSRTSNGGNVVEFQTTAPLERREGLTIAVKMPKGSIAAPSQRQELGWFWRDNAAFIMGFVGFLVIGYYYFWAWQRVGRDPPAGIMVPRWDAPDGISPAQVHYIDNKGLSGHDAFSSALLNLAVKGLVELEDLKGDVTIKPTGAILRQPLPVGEAAILQKLGTSGQEFRIAKSNTAAVRSVTKKFRSALNTEHRNKFFDQNLGYVFAGIGISLLTLILTIVAAGGGANFVIPLVILIAIATVITMVTFAVGLKVSRSSGLVGKVGSVMRWFVLGFFVMNLFPLLGSLAVDMTIKPVILAIIAGVFMINILFFFLLGAPTPLGRHLMDGIEGLKTYINLAEKDRMNLAGAPAMSPQHFETMLPYAVALGLEKPWSNAFQAWLASAAGAATAASYSPNWYRGGNFSSGSIGKTMSGLPASIGKSMTNAMPAPKSSSSGFSGGGSSGGGGGGGGGGGW